jgi:hypothetical protein
MSLPRKCTHGHHHDRVHCRRRANGRVRRAGHDLRVVRGPDLEDPGQARRRHRRRGELRDRSGPGDPRPCACRGHPVAAGGRPSGLPARPAGRGRWVRRSRGRGRAGRGPRDAPLAAPGARRNPPDAGGALAGDVLWRARRTAVGALDPVRAGHPGPVLRRVAVPRGDGPPCPPAHRQHGHPDRDRDVGRLRLLRGRAVHRRVPLLRGRGRHRGAAGAGPLLRGPRQEPRRPRPACAARARRKTGPRGPRRQRTAGRHRRGPGRRPAPRESRRLDSTRRVISRASWSWRWARSSLR